MDSCPSSSPPPSLRPITHKHRLLEPFKRLLKYPYPSHSCPSLRTWGSVPTPSPTAPSFASSANTPAQLFAHLSPACNCSSKTWGCFLPHLHTFCLAQTVNVCWGNRGPHFIIRNTWGLKAHLSHLCSWDSGPLPLAWGGGRKGPEASTSLYFGGQRFTSCQTLRSIKIYFSGTI